MFSLVSTKFLAMRNTTLYSVTRMYCKQSNWNGFQVRGHSTTTWTEFCRLLRGQFLYPERGQKQTFFDVVIEYPLRFKCYLLQINQEIYILEERNISRDRKICIHTYFRVLNKHVSFLFYCRKLFLQHDLIRKYLAVRKNA